MSLKGIVLAGLAVAGSAAALPAEAHHSIQAVVDTTRTLQDEMVLARVDWINPHAWFHFDMTTANGRRVSDVMVEWLSLTGLRQAGYASPAVFSVGHPFQVRYYPNRDGSPGGQVVSLTDEVTGKVFDRHGSEPAPDAGL